MKEFLGIDIPFEDPVLIFALVMVIILVAPLVFRKLKIPGLVGLILSGTVVGPGMLGLIERDFTIELLGTVGLLYLMFMAGLSIDLNRFEKMKGRSIGFGLISFLFPLGAALLTGVYILDYSLLTSLLLGAIVGSHTLLAYPIAERLGITKNNGVTMTMGGTLVTDTLSLGILAVVAGTIAENTGTGYWVKFGITVAIFVVSAILTLPRVARWFFRNMKYENNIDFVFMVAVLFVTAFLADLAGLAPIIGAFMAGLLLNRLVPESGTLMSRVQFVGNVFFIPFFLISVGMLIDLNVLADLDVWVKAFFFSLLVFAGKGLASLLVKYPFRYSAEEVWVIFGMTTPQSAATLAVTLVGFELGFFDTTAVNAVVIMILVTCLVGPWLVEKYGRIVAVQDDDKPYNPSDAPQRILVPLANPETSVALMDIAFMVKDENSGQPIYPLTVARDDGNTDENVSRGENMLSHAVKHAAAAEIAVSPVTRIDLNIADGITRAVKEQLISNVIIGWNGQNTARKKIFGSILDQMLDQLDEMVMVCKIEKPVNTFERILLAIPPFSTLEPGFYETIRSVKLMANHMGADLVILSTTQREALVKKQVEKIKPEADTEYKGLEKWADLTTWIAENSIENDLLVLCSSRKGNISWRPGLDRLPGFIAQRFPDLSFITIYSSETEWNSKGEGNTAERILLSAERIKTGLSEESIESVLEKIIEGDREFEAIELSRITRRLLENSTDYTPEAMPGVFIFDAHTSKVSSQLLFVGVTRKAIKVPHTASKASVIFVFLSPKNTPVDDHLKGLNKVLKLIRPQDVSHLENAESAKEVYQFLMKR